MNPVLIPSSTPKVILLPYTTKASPPAPPGHEEVGTKQPGDASDRRGYRGSPKTPTAVGLRVPWG